MGHASAGDEKGVYRLSEGTVGTSGLDYLALGHIHARSLARIGDVLYGYSGCACGRDFGECGEKGVYVLTDLGGTLREEFVCTGGQRYYREALDITGCTDTEDIAARINDFIRLRGIRTEDCLRLSLRGRIRSDMRVEPALTEAMCALDYITVTDETLPIADIDALRSDPGLRGEFFRMLEADILSDDERARDSASLALKLGLAAIDGGNIDEIR